MASSDGFGRNYGGGRARSVGYPVDTNECLENYTDTPRPPEFGGTPDANDLTILTGNYRNAPGSNTFWGPVNHRDTGVDDDDSDPTGKTKEATGY